MVIAIANQEIAEEVIGDLLAKGVAAEKIFWTPAYGYRNPWFDWNKAVYYAEGENEK